MLKFVDNFKKLTPREKQIVQLLADGLNGTEIAEQFDLSKRTVETYRLRIRKRIGIRRDIKICLAAYRFGLIKINA